jgi:hypothetical protein
VGGERRELRECYFSIRIMDGNATVLPKHRSNLNVSTKLGNLL